MNGTTKSVAVIGAAVLLMTTVHDATADQAADSERRPPSARPYINDETGVVHDHGTMRTLELENYVDTFLKTAHGYALTNWLDDKLYLYGKGGEGTLVGRNLMHNSNGETAVVSADGKRIAYVVEPRDDRLARLVVRTTKDGSLVREHELQNPDTQVLAYRNGRVWFKQGKGFAGRFVVETATVKEIRKGRGEVTAVNPRDGMAASFIWPGPDQWERWKVVKLRGKRKPKVLWRLPEGSEMESWSPNGRYVVTVDWDGNGDQVQGITVRNARTGTVVRRVKHEWMGDGDRVAWLGSDAILAVHSNYMRSKLKRYRVRGGSKVVATFDDEHDPTSVPWIPALPRP